MKDNIPYDFSFKNDASALYCFELVALCYQKLNIQKINFKKLFGVLKKNAYLADSFRENDNFHIIFEFNPKHNIDR